MADDTTAAMAKAIERGREDLRLIPPNGVPRDPFYFHEPAEIEYFSKPDTTYTLWRTVDGLRFTFHRLKPTIEPSTAGPVVKFDVSTAFVSWEEALETKTGRPTGTDTAGSPPSNGGA